MLCAVRGLPAATQFVHCDDSWVVVECPGLTLSYTGLVPF